MAAFTHTSASVVLWAVLLGCVVAAPAPLAEGDVLQSNALDYHNETASRCYYNFQHYEEGDRIVTNEPCLNCTCHKRMLMCYLRVCPFTKAVGQDCTIEKKPDQCCPVITCPQVPVDILTSSTTTQATTSKSTAVGHLSNFGCTLEDNTFYPDGVQMPSDPKKPCELCYCIRNHTACVRQECTLNVEGCRPVYQDGVCCPVRYDCDYEISTTEQPNTGGLVLGTTANPLQCRYGDTLYNDGELMVTEKPCESCYCMRGDIVCAVRSCGMPMEGKDCQPLPPPEGECCPTTFQCANGTIPVEAVATESSIVMHPGDLGATDETESEQPAEETTNGKVGQDSDQNQKEGEHVPETEVSSNNPPSEEGKEPEKIEENKIDDQPSATVEHVESDPTDADELEEDEVLSSTNPSAHDGSEHSDDHSTNSSLEPSEDLLTTPNSSSIQETELQSTPSTQSGINVEENLDVLAGPSGIVSDVIEPELDTSELEKKPENEDKNKVPIETGSAPEEEKIIESNETHPEIPQPVSEVLSEANKTPQEHVETENVKDEQELDLAPTGPEAVTDAAQSESELPNESIHSEEPAPITTDDKKEETLPSSIEEESKEPGPATDNANKSVDENKESELKPQGFEGPPSSGPVPINHSDVSTGIVSDTMQDTKTDLTGSVPVADVTETNTEDIKGELGKDETVPEESTANETGQESEPKPHVEVESSAINENNMVLKESGLKTPESPEALDQIKESDSSTEKEVDGSLAPPSTNTEDGLAKPTSDDKPEIVQEQVEIEDKPLESAVEEETQKASETPEAPDKHETPLITEHLPKEPFPPRKEDAAVEESEQHPQHPDGSMTKAEDSIPTEIPKEEESETTPIKEEESETKPVITSPVKVDGKPTAGVEESEITLDISEGTEDTTSSQHEAEVHESSLNIQTEQPLEPEIPLDHVSPHQETPQEPSGKPIEIVDNAAISESPQISISEGDQSKSSEPIPASDAIEFEPSIDEMKPTEKLSNEGDATPSSVVAESEVETVTDSVLEVSEDDQTKPKTPISPEESVNTISNVLASEENTLIQTQSSGQESENTAEQEAGGSPIVPLVELGPPESTESAAEAKPTQDETKQDSTEHFEESEPPEITNNVSEDNSPPSSVDESSTNGNEIAFEDKVPTKDHVDDKKVPEDSKEQLTPSKDDNGVLVEQSAPSTDTEGLTVTEKDSVEQDLPEIIATGTIPNESIPEKQEGETYEKEGTQTESYQTEESSTDTSFKAETENKLEGVETEKEESDDSHSESKPLDESVLAPTSPELENKPSEENTGTNEFQEVLHDPVESDPTDFEDQQFEETDHLVNESPSENEIVDDHQQAHGGAINDPAPPALPGPIGVIPGEGDCLVDGQTYSNNSKIPSKSPCHKECTCLSSIVHCQGIDCPPPPPQLANCMPVHQGELCCPVYTCDGNTPEGPQSHNQMGQTEEQKPLSESSQEATESSQSEPSTDLPNSSTVEKEPVDTNANEKPDQISPSGETKPEENTNPVATDVAEETQSTADGAESSSQEQEKPVAESPSIPEEIHPSSPEEATQAVTEDHLDSSAAPIAQESGGSLQAGELPATDSETQEQASDEEKHSDETSNEKDTTESVEELQKSPEEGASAETQTLSSEATHVTEEESSVILDSDSNVSLATDHSQEGVESKPDVLTDHTQTHDSESEGLVPTDETPALEVPSVPEETNVVLEPESPPNVGEDGANQIKGDVINESLFPPASETQEAVVSYETLPETSSEIDDSHKSGTEAPIIENTEHDSSSSSETISLSEEVSTAVKPEEQISGTGTENLGKNPSLDFQETHPSAEDQEVQTSESGSQTSQDVKPTESPLSTEEHVHSTAQPIKLDGSAAEDESAEQGEVSIEQHGGVHGQPQESLEDEEVKHEEHVTQGPGDSIEQESTENPNIEESEQITKSPGSESLTESVKPANQNVEDVQPHQHEEIPELPNIEDVSHDETETHPVGTPTEVSQTQESLSGNVPSSEAETTSEQPVVGSEKEELPATGTYEVEKNEVASGEESALTSLSEEQNPVDGLNVQQGTEDSKTEVENKPEISEPLEAHTVNSMEPEKVEHHLDSSETTSTTVGDESGVISPEAESGQPPEDNVVGAEHDTDVQNQVPPVESVHHDATDELDVETESPYKETAEKNEDSISTQEHGDKLPGPETADSTISTMPENIPQTIPEQTTEEQISETVSSTHESNIPSGESSKPDNEPTESDDHSGEPSIPGQETGQLTEDSEKPSQEVEHHTHDPEHPDQEVEQPVHETEPPVDDIPHEGDHISVDTHLEPEEAEVNTNKPNPEEGTSLPEELGPVHGEENPISEEESLSQGAEVLHEGGERPHEDGESIHQEEPIQGQDLSVHEEEAPDHGEVVSEHVEETTAPGLEEETTTSGQEEETTAPGQDGAAVVHVQESSVPTPHEEEETNPEDHLVTELEHPSEEVEQHPTQDSEHPAKLDHPSQDSDHYPTLDAEQNPTQDPEQQPTQGVEQHPTQDAEQHPTQGTEHHFEDEEHVQQPQHPTEELEHSPQEAEDHIQESALPTHEPEHQQHQETEAPNHESEQAAVPEIEESLQVHSHPEQPTSASVITEGTQPGGDEESKPKPDNSEIPTEDQFPTGADMDYDVSEDGAFGPGTCRYGGKVYVSAQQIPRDDPCDFCFCFRSDIICLQQSCPPPIHRCHQEPIQGYCCPRYQCPVSMATSLNLTTTTTTTTTTLPPHFFAHAYHGAAKQAGCLHRGRAYNVGEEIVTASGPCLQCICGSDGQMKCDPVVCSPEPMLRKMMEAAVSHRRR